MDAPGAKVARARTQNRGSQFVCDMGNFANLAPGDRPALASRPNRSLPSSGIKEVKRKVEEALKTMQLSICTHLRWSLYALQPLKCEAQRSLILMKYHNPSSHATLQNYFRKSIQQSVLTKTFFTFRVSFPAAELSLVLSSSVKSCK